MKQHKVSLIDIFTGNMPSVVKCSKGAAKCSKMIQNFTDNKKTNYSINTMSDKQKLQTKLEKMLADYDNGHRKLKKLKDDMRLLRMKIAGMPKEMIDTRPDEIELKSD